MAAYKPARSIYISDSGSPEDKEILKNLNKLAKERDEPVSATARWLLKHYKKRST